MINVSSEFKSTIAADKRDYLGRIVITLKSGQVLNLDNTKLRSYAMEDAVSSDTQFTALGSAAINQFTFTIDNIDDDYSEYVFEGATVVAYLDLVLLDDSLESIRKGTFIVDSTNYTGDTIVITCLDYMSKFDVPYSESTLGYPATLNQIISEACSKCDVILGTNTFPHRTFTIQNPPEKESVTFREVISWVAQIAGCYARCNTEGKLELKWFDELSLEEIEHNLLLLDTVAPYLNTTTGMQQIVSTRQDDQTNTITGVDWFTFDSKTANPIYVNSNSWIVFGGTSPGTSSSLIGDFNLCKRDGQLVKLYRQATDDFLKIRYDGYTRYSSSSQVEPYHLIYELFLLTSGKMFLNVIQIPTSSTYMGESSIVTTAGTTTFTPVVGSYIFSLNTDTGLWEYFIPDNLARIFSLYSQNIAVDDTVITGVEISVKVKDKTNNDSIRKYKAGTSGYVIGISEDNEFITVDNAEEIKTWLATQLIGVQFRKADVSHTSDPTIEAGDIGIIRDRKGILYPILITRTNFGIGTQQRTVCGSETPSRNSATRYRESTKNYVLLRQQIVDEKTDREQALEDLQEQLDAQNEMFIDKEFDADNNLTAIIIHNKPLIADSDIIWKITTNAFGVSTDGGQTYNLGATADGTLITQVLQTVGINAEWITTGTLTIGGVNNQHGQLRVLNASGQRVGYWDNSGLYIGNITSTLTYPNTKIATNGAITTKSLTANDYIYIDATSNTGCLIKFPSGFSGAGGNNYITLNNSGFLRKAGNCTISMTDWTVSTGANVYSALYVKKTDNNTYSSISSELIKISTSSTPDPSSLYSSDMLLGIDRLNLPNVANFNSSYIRLYKNTTVQGSLSVTGTKPRLVTTKDYGQRYLYCYETPSPMFGDIGEGTISADGKCYVQIDSIFAETVTLNQYQVFLQKYGEGDCWIAERKSSYFVVEGTAGLKFGWELKAKQFDFDQYRLEKEVGDLTKIDYSVENPKIDYAQELDSHINQLAQERSYDV